MRRDTIDASRYRFLALRLRERNTSSDHDQPHELLINLKAESIVPGGLYQFPLRLPAFNTWYPVFIPFRAFVLTDRGHVLQHQKELHRYRLLSVGLSTISQQPKLLHCEWLQSRRPKIDFAIIGLTYTDFHKDLYSIMRNKTAMAQG